MIGAPSSLTVRVSRKHGDKDFGSFGGEWECTVNLPPNVSLEEESQALFAFGKAFLGAELAEIQAGISKHQAAKPAPEKPEPEYVPVSEDGAEFKDIVVEFIKVVFSEEGEKRAKTFGKPWDKFGVTTYPEALAAVGFDLEAANPGQYPLPAPYTKARVLLGGKNAKGFDIAKKVDHFVK